MLEFLRATYRDVDQIEFYVGLFAEDPDPNSPLPTLMGEMVAVDAFSQALTNPLLSKHVMADKIAAFSALGWETIADTSSLRDILQRHVTSESDISSVSMDLG